jgi:hypothetical protein
MRRDPILLLLLGALTAATIAGCSKADNPLTGGSSNNKAPVAPSGPTPANGATLQPTTLTLRWSGSDPDGDVLNYVVLFGTANTPIDTIAKNLTTPSFSKKNLDQGMTYYWQVIARDNHGGVTPGPVWSFTTGSLSGPGLIAFYPFNNDANDESGRGHDGIVEEARFTTDRFGHDSSALFFNGSNAFVMVPHADDLNFGTSTDFTLAAWVRFDTYEPEYAGIISKMIPGSAQPFRGWQLGIGGGSQAVAQVESSIGWNGDVTGSTSLDDGRWHVMSLVVQRASQKMTLSVDGVVEATLPAPMLSGSLDNTTQLFIGKDRNSTRFFKGSIDDVRIYNYALSDTEVQSLAGE